MKVWLAPLRRGDRPLIYGTKAVPLAAANAISRLSGKEGAKDVPDWARGNRPCVGENGRDFAKRLMDEKYGPGNWTPKEFEYRQIQKWGDRSFRDPRSVLSPEDDHI